MALNAATHGLTEAGLAAVNVAKDADIDIVERLRLIWHRGFARNARDSFNDSVKKFRCAQALATTPSLPVRPSESSSRLLSQNKSQRPSHNVD